MANDTKERILNKSFEMFVERGYNGTNLRDLAAELGISKSAIYRHFRSKDDIWDAIVSRVEQHYDSRFGTPGSLPSIPDSLNEFIELVMRMLDFTIHDKNVVLARKLLMSEQFHVDKARILATKHFSVEIELIFEELFSEMMRKGLLKYDDPTLLAFAFSAPISEVIYYIDREPEMENEAMDKINKFIEHFVEMYGG